MTQPMFFSRFMRRARAAICAIEMPPVSSI